MSNEIYDDRPIIAISKEVVELPLSDLVARCLELKTNSDEMNARYGVCLRELNYRLHKLKEIQTDNLLILASIINGVALKKTEFPTPENTPKEIVKVG